MILHFSHIGLTDGRTFMIPFGLFQSTRLWLPCRPPLPRRGLLAQAGAWRLRARRRRV